MIATSTGHPELGQNAESGNFQDGDIVDIPDIPEIGKQDIHQPSTSLASTQELSLSKYTQCSAHYPRRTGAHMECDRYMSTVRKTFSTVRETTTRSSITISSTAAISCNTTSATATTRASQRATCKPRKKAGGCTGDEQEKCREK